MLFTAVLVGMGACGLRAGGDGFADFADAPADASSLDGAAIVDDGGVSDDDADAAIARDAGTTESGAADASTDASTDAVADAAVDAAGDAAIDAGPPPATITQSVALGVTVDRVSPLDQGGSGDSQLDGAASLVVVGPIDGLALLTTNGGGVPQGNHQWDTLVASDPTPALGTTFTVGSQTWLLGVYDGATKRNDGAGRISLGPGVHTLTVYGANAGQFAAGQRFRVYARATGTSTWTAGPVFSF